MIGLVKKSKTLSFSSLHSEGVGIGAYKVLTKLVVMFLLFLALVRKQRR